VVTIACTPGINDDSRTHFANGHLPAVGLNLTLQEHPQAFAIRGF
jgi:hypothetical protein